MSVDEQGGNIFDRKTTVNGASERIPDYFEHLGLYIQAPIRYQFTVIILCQVPSAFFVDGSSITERSGPKI